MPTMPEYFQPLYFAIAMLLGMVMCLDLGWRIGKWRLAKEPGTESGVGAMEGAIFALFGLLLAFTFSGAAGRFDERRDLIMQEANAIGTAYLRVDLLPEPAQPALRALFREYLEARLATYRRGADDATVAAEYQRSLSLQSEIWRLSTAAAQQSGMPAVMSLVMPALNDMFDITTTRLAATRKHPPATIFGMLFGLGLMASLVAGYSLAGSRHRPWFHSWAFATVIAATVYVIMDIEYPRRGLIRVDAADQLLVDVLNGMK